MGLRVWDLFLTGWGAAHARSGADTEMLGRVQDHWALFREGSAAVAQRTARSLVPCRRNENLAAAHPAGPGGLRVYSVDCKLLCAV